MFILVYFLDQIIIYKNMKNKKNNKIISYSGLLNNSNNNFSLISQDISYQGEKNEYSNKKIKPYYYRKKKSRQINSLDEITKKFMKCVQEAEILIKYGVKLVTEGYWPAHLSALCPNNNMTEGEIYAASVLDQFILFCFIARDHGRYDCFGVQTGSHT